MHELRDQKHKPLHGHSYAPLHNIYMLAKHVDLLFHYLEAHLLFFFCH